MADLNKEARSVVMAWVNAGNNPAYHYRKMEEIRASWPTLYIAIQELVNKAVKE